MEVASTGFPPYPMTSMLEFGTLSRLFSRWLLLPLLWSPLWAASDYATPYVFTTLAGVSSIGSADGLGSAARFYQPQGVAVDSAGNIYVADSDNDTIRKISPDGVVTTLAGAAGQPGSADGPGSLARFDFPSSLVVDAAGIVYVADANNHAIRKITPLGTVSTLAGAPGVPGSNDGDGGDARFHRPEGITIDQTGTLYVADAGNQLIRKITPAGTVTTLAGTAGAAGWADGFGREARFSTPFRISIDRAGTLYVAELGNRTIRKITPTGTVTTHYFYDAYIYISGFTSGHSIPAGVAVDAAGVVWFTDAWDNTICRISAAGAVTTIAGTNDTVGSSDGIGTAARFNHPVAVALDPSGNLLVADRDNHAIRKITAQAGVTTVAGLGLQSSHGSIDGPGASARFEDQMGIAVGADGNVYVADTLNHIIRRISPDGQVLTVAGTAGVSGSSDGAGSVALFNHPAGIALDRLGNVYVADRDNFVIRKIAPTGVVTTLAGSPGAQGLADGTSTARFNRPAGITVDLAGNVYVHDSTLIRKISPTGNVTTFDTALGYGLNYGLAIDGAGNLYLSGDHAVRKITPGGVVTTLAGIPSIVIKAAEGYITQAYPGSADGAGNTARFNAPEAVAVDAGANVFVADTGNQTIRWIAPDGTVLTLAGLTGAVGSTDDKGNAARFDYPSGLALDSSGNLYVASGTTIRKGRLADQLPFIMTQPQSQSVTTGTGVTFTVSASGVPAPTYQWFFNGSPFTGATSSTLSFTNVRISDAGDYTVVVTNALGTATSNKATLTVAAAAPTPPTQPSSSGGGGGAINGWLVLALIALGAVRRLCARRQAVISAPGL